MKLDHYFQDPAIDDCEELIRQIRVLHAVVSPLVDPRVARVPGIIHDYERYLEGVELSQEGKDPRQVLSGFAHYFKGAVRWHHPWTMINITPPPLLPAVAATTVASLFNPNLALDVSCGGLGITELEVIKHISDLVGWDWRRAFGVFTFGGKGTDLYGVKTALRRIVPDATQRGIYGTIAISSTEQCHPCHVEICDWLGIGKDNCLRLPTATDGSLDLVAARAILADYLSKGGTLACIMLSGGTTLNYAIDPILKVVEMRESLVEEFGLSYKPHLHVDAVLGWVWLFFKSYDFTANAFKLDAQVLNKIAYFHRAIAQLKFADSFGLDFHKLGFCPYLSSLFMARRKEWIDNLGTSKQPSLSELEFGNFAPFTYTLESSRPANGSVAALVALKTLGYEGFQKLVSGLLCRAEQARSGFDRIPGFATVNHAAMGSAILFIVLPADASLTYEELRSAPERPSLRVAEYNHKFYLFLLEKQITERSPVALDYVAGYETNRTGIKLGVLKMYLVSPFCDEAKMGELLVLLNDYKREFDQIESAYIPRVCPYRPKPLVLR